ncbi:hypothetical protein JCM10213_001555 [Rhodosporidiobolus nylandii]
MAAAAPPAMPQMDDSIGAFLVGTIISIFLAGITAVQGLHYFDTFGRSDRKLLVGIVSFLMTTDVFHTAISCYTIYLWTVTNYGNLAIMVHSPWSFTWDPFLTGVVAFVVQSFYAWRVYIVSKRQWYIPAFIMVLSLLQLAFAAGSTWKIYLLNTEFARFGEFQYGVATWLLAAAAADIIITSSLIYYLRAATSNDHQRSTSIVQKIIRLTVETNGLTCLFAVADAILFVAMPAASWHVIPNLSLVKLYTNGCLVSLNARKAFQQPYPHSGAQLSGSYANGPAPKYSPGSNSAASPGLITPGGLNSSYGASSPQNEKRGFTFGLNRSRPGSGERRNIVNGVHVETHTETVTRVASRDDSSDLEKGLDRDTAQAFELECVTHRADSQEEGHHVVPTLPHAYAANAPQSTSTSTLPVTNTNPTTGAPAPHSTGMGGAIPREWS